VLVIDASVLADALIDDGPAGHASRRALGDDLHWLAPAHLPVEVLSVIRGRALGGKLGEARAAAAVAALVETSLELVDALPYAGPIWALRANLTAYDAAYVALAEQAGCELLTCDAKLARAATPHCAVRLVSAASHQQRDRR